MIVRKRKKKGLDGTVKNFECYVRMQTFVPFRSDKSSKVSEQWSKIVKVKF